MSRALLMRLQVAPTPVHKRVTTLREGLAHPTCLRCAKRIDKGGPFCDVGENKKCAHCKKGHHFCEQVSRRNVRAAMSHANRG